jgi:hypothetical protein
MPSKSSRKGYAYERELIEQLTKEGFKCQRAWGSDGRSIGVEPDVDIIADDIKIQAKRRKAIPKWLELGNCDVVMFRGDHRESFAVIPVKEYVRLLSTDK